MGLGTCVESSPGLSGLDGPCPCAPEALAAAFGAGASLFQGRSKPQGRILGSLVY